MRGDVVSDFIEPLIGLGFQPRGDVVQIAEAIAEDAAGATRHQLHCAVRAIRRTRKFATFPSLAECLDAIKAAPIREVEERPVTKPAATRASSSEPPCLLQARRYANDYEEADEWGRRRMDRASPHRYEAALAVMRAYEPFATRRPVVRDQLSEQEAAAFVASVVGSPERAWDDERRGRR
jgi:hypothetical protein